VRRGKELGEERAAEVAIVPGFIGGPELGEHDAPLRLERLLVHPLERRAHPAQLRLHRKPMVSGGPTRW
jgi:hypothetical protein